ncbi:MAG: hypothetical protein KC420_21710, partial [Myxococcales bacterium]|nr:hypothetical protein [Myxococcales bacterium]
MLAANDLLTTTTPCADATVERIPLLFRQLQIEARELRELVIGVGDGTVSARAVPGATHVGVRATVICDD